MENSNIDKVGVEIEGGWKKTFSQSQSYHHDGSVDLSSSGSLIFKNKRKVPSRSHLKTRGEFITSATDNLNLLKNEIRLNYPDIFNHTCGFHVHVSLKTLQSYSLLMHRNFFDAFTDTMNLWAKTRLTSQLDRDLFLPRLEGKNRYCWKRFEPVSQLRGEAERYTQLNFCAFLKYRTLECRLFPVFKDYRNTISGTLTFLNLINFYLKKAVPNSETESYLNVLKEYN